MNYSKRTRTRPAPWTTMKNGRKPAGWTPKGAKEKKRIRPMSANRRRAMEAYRKLRSELIDGSNCTCCFAAKVTDIHHTRGRAGSLLTDRRYVIAVCRACHNWIGEHPAEARRKGWIAEAGKWNDPR